MAGQIFERHERKFLITEDNKKEIMKLYGEQLVIDKFSKEKGYSEVYSIYFDDVYDDIIRVSNDKPIYKEKLRVRSYSLDLKDNDFVFLEIKKKYNRVGSKRRIKLTYAEYQEFLKRKKLNKSDDYLHNQITNEIEHFINQKKVYPKIIIGCRREAYYGKNDDSLRITFDSNIIYRKKDNISFTDLKESDNKNIILTDKIIMEIKFKYAIPFDLMRILSNMNRFSQGYSKYGNAFKQMKNIKKNKNLK